MWLFTRYGFYSIACARSADGALDPQTVMVRARCRSQLQALQKRFPALATAEILELPHSDYRFRIVIPKETWNLAVTALVEEQDWSNFKNEVASFQGSAGSEYVHALHDVWTVMYELQEKPRRNQNRSSR